MDIETRNTNKPFEFTGNGTEYFKIWIVNILLSIITLGIYSAWATVRNKRYFYGNTCLDGSSFEYHALPMQILKGRIIAMILYIIYVLTAESAPYVALGILGLVVLLLPWLLWSRAGFNARMSSYRNVHFSFVGSLWNAYIYILIYPLLVILVSYLVWKYFGLASALVAILVLIPFVHKSYTSYMINNAEYGKSRFSANITTREFYWVYIYIFILLLIGALVMAVPVSFVYGTISDILQGSTFNIPDGEFIKGIIIIYLLYIVGSLLIKAIFKSTMRNYVYNNTQFDNVAQLHSKLKARKLFALYLGNLILIVFTLGLATPWVKVRLARYECNSLSMDVEQNIPNYVNEHLSKQSSLGDEIGDAFDVSLDMGLSL